MQHRLSELTFRILLSLIFLTAGLQHLMRPSAVTARLENAPFLEFALVFGTPTVLVLLSGVGLVAGGLGLLFGVRTRWAAMGLLAILIPITITVQFGGLDTLGPLMKNMAIAGGLVHFIAQPNSAPGLESWLLSRSALRPQGGSA